MKSDLDMTDNSGPSDQTINLSSKPSNFRPHCGKNVLNLLVQREMCPRTKCGRRKQWREATLSQPNLWSGPKCQAGVRDAKRGLVSWVEEASLQHLSAKYCPLVPPPRSTIAAAFSPDGKTIASTHGDHTVKIIDYHSGNCIKVLTGHRRTPWVVRFHPLRPEIIASGSLDQEVRLWNVITSECIGSRDFYRPIASIAFHAGGELLAVASGHKLYVWQYNMGPGSSSPTIVLKTKRSLRAVQFHPYGAPFLMTAEVNDLDFSGSSMTRATSSDGSRMQLHLFTENMASSSMQMESSARLQIQADSNVSQLYDHMVFPMDTFATSAGSYPISEDTGNSYRHDRVRGSGDNSVADVAGTSEINPIARIHPGGSNSFARSRAPSSAAHGAFGQALDDPELGEHEQLIQVLAHRESAEWELPYLQGRLVGHSQIGSTSSSEVPVGSSSLHQGLHSHVLHGSADEPVYLSEDGSGSQPNISRIQSELANMLAATTQELPCTVKLRVWSHDVQNPCELLTEDKCRMIIPHAVLCSEMGAHFSPCGRYLAACVVCVLPNTGCDPGLQTLSSQDDGAATSPTHHPISAHQVAYELKIYSLEEATFGSVLVSRVIRAAHCLTSIQFSPTSEHVLLSYGRRHGSLLKFVVIDGEETLPIYTVLEIYKVTNLELVRELPSAEDEVNVACFHPYVGGGLVYGTKEGKLRVLQFDGNHEMNCFVPDYFLNASVQS